MKIKKIILLLFYFLLVLSPRESRAMITISINHSTIQNALLFFATSYVVVHGISALFAYSSIDSNTPVIIQQNLFYFYKKLWKKVVDGSDIQKTEIRSFSDLVDTVFVSGDAEVSINVDEKHSTSIKIIGDDTIIPYVATQVINNCLYVNQNDYLFNQKTPLKYIIYLQKINKIVLSDKVELWIQGFSVEDKSKEYEQLNSRPPSQCSEKDIKEYKKNLRITFEALPWLDIKLSGASSIGGCYTGNTIERNISLDLSDNATAHLDSIVKSRISMSDSSSCRIAYCGNMTINATGSAKIDVTGGCNISGIMSGSSKLSLTRYEQDYKKVKVAFTQLAGYGNTSYWE